MESEKSLQQQITAFTSEVFPEKSMQELRKNSLAGLGDAKILELAQKLPKIDLHRHLEGAIEPETLLELAARHQIPLPETTIENLRPLVQITDKDRTLLDFLKKFEVIGKIFTGYQVIEELTTLVIRDASRDGVIYLELRFSPIYMAQAYNLDQEKVIQAVLRGTKKAETDYPIKTNLILIVERQMGLAKAWEVEKLAEKYLSYGVVALDLANDEFHFPPAPYAPVFQQAKLAGSAITVHAGEAGGPENIRTAIEQLAADRIGHGVRSYLNSDVEKLVREKKIPLELCLTSNQQTGAIPLEKIHPLGDYFSNGIIATINTDDPGISGITLSSEILKAVKLFGFSLEDLKSLTINAANSAFLSAMEKQRLTELIERGFKKVAEKQV